MRLSRRQGLRCLALAAVAPGALWPQAARAQVDWSRVAVPAYDAVALLQGLYRHWALPQLAQAVAASQALQQTLQPWAQPVAPTVAAGNAAERDTVRLAWRHAVRAWEPLAAVPLGPLLQRRSLRRIDFQPARPALIQRALAALPPAGQPGAVPDLKALERVGTPAKGYPALEWLLWQHPPAAAGAAAWRLALGLAQEISDELQQLQQDFTALAEREADDWDEDSARAALAEWVNQWVGGLERLRWAQMDKPRQAGRPEQWPRAASGQTRVAWAQAWTTLRRMAVLDAATAPAPGTALVPLETWLRGRGLNPLAQRLREQVAAVDAALAPLAPGQPGFVADSIVPAVTALAALKQFAEAELAPALDVSIGFSDADGD